MQQLLEEKRYKWSKILVWACFFLYVFMMSSKNVYTAELVTLQGVFGTTKAQTSLAMTYYFITYAIGQFVLSFFMGKINLRIYLFATGTLSAIITILLGLSKSISFMYVLCGINGVFQAGIYAGCMGVLSKYLPVDLLPYGNTVMNIGVAAWGVISYGTTALFVGSGLWNAAFILLGALFFLSTVFFLFVALKIRKFPSAIQADIKGDIKKDTIIKEEKPFIALDTKNKKVIFWVIALSMSFLANIAYYIVSNWIPDMMHDVFGMPEEYSILITLIVPIISAICSTLSINLCEKYKDIIKVSIIFLLISILTMLPLVFILRFNVIITVVLLAVSMAAGTGYRTVFGGVMAFKMRLSINSGSYLAATNSVAAVMAGVVPPLVGSFIDSFGGTSGYGWSYLLMVTTSTVYLLVLLLFKKWKKSIDKQCN